MSGYDQKWWNHLLPWSAGKAKKEKNLHFYDINCAGMGTVQERQTWGRKAPGFSWAIFGLASCIIVQQGLSLSLYPTFPSLLLTLTDLPVIDLVSNPV